MTLWVAGIVLLIWPGLLIWRVPTVQRMDLPARLSIAMAAGMLAVSIVMYVCALVGISWTRVAVGTPLLILGALGVRRGGGGRWRAMGWVVVLLALVTYAALTARLTCADLMYFWGPKAIRFHRAGTIDTVFLAWPHYYLMHPDYPPLLPLVYAWGNLVAHKFSYWGALLLTPLWLGTTVFAFRGIVRDCLTDEVANRYSVLLTAVLAYGYAIGMVGGAGEPPLLFYETIALAALTFGKERGAWIIAAVALAGIVFTKVEGAAFAAVVLTAFVLTRRKILPAIAAAVPAIVLIGSWILFAKHHNLLDAYGRSGKPLRLDNLGLVATVMGKKAAYDAAYLPWIASLAPLAVTRNWRRAALPLLTGVGVIAYTAYFYLHEPQPTYWIQSSAERVLLTALMCFVVASAAGADRSADVC